MESSVQNEAPTESPDLGMPLLLDVLTRLAQPLSNSELLPEITLAARRLLRAERAAVWLKADSEDVLVLAVSGEATGHRLPFGRGLAGTTAASRAVLNVVDCPSDPRFDPELDRRTGFRTRNSLTLPLTGADGSLVGVLQILNREVPPRADESPVAAALAAQCCIALLRTRAAQLLVEAQETRRELELAREVQQATLPRQHPVASGYSVQALYLPAEMTGGDAYDIQQDSGELQLMLADASGHGLAPALAAVQMHAMWRVALQAGLPLGMAVSCIDDQLCDLLPANRFVSAWLAVLDANSHRLLHYCAGQAPVLFRHQGLVRRLPADGPPLGTGLGARPVSPRELVLEDGDVIVVASDGMYEQSDASGSMWGVEAAEAIVASTAGLAADALAARLLEAWRGHRGDTPQGDDLTLLVLCRHAPQTGFTDLS